MMIQVAIGELLGGGHKVSLSLSSSIGGDI